MARSLFCSLAVVLLFGFGCRGADPLSPNTDAGMSMGEESKPVDAGVQMQPERDGGTVEKDLGLGVLPAPAGPAVFVSASEPFKLVYDTRAQNPSRYLNDHSLIQAKDGTWHLFSIVGKAVAPSVVPDPALERTLAHATAPSLQGPWTPQPDVLPVSGTYFDEDFIWAPHVVESGGTYYLFYAGGGATLATSPISLATSTDLYNWTRLPSGPLFRDGILARDPYVTRINDQWVMYYCGSEQPAGGRHAVLYRTSTDLVRWSERHVAFLDVTTNGNMLASTESPTVIREGDNWFLFIGPRGNYEGTDVFVSKDPFHFEISGLAGHLPSHALEVVRDGANTWVTADGWVERGLFIAPLRFQTFAPVTHSREAPAFVPADAGGVTVVARERERGRVQLRTKSQAGEWGQWIPFGDPAATTPSWAVDGAGRLHLFSVEANAQRVQLRTREATGEWKPWRAFAGPAGAAPSVIQQKDGRLAAFLLGAAGKDIQWAQQDASGEFGPWQTFGGPAGGPPTVVSNADGRLEVFALSPSQGCLAHRVQTAANGNWLDWDCTFGGPAAQSPTVAHEADGRLSVFAEAPLGMDIFFRTQTSPGGAYGAWLPFWRGVFSSPPNVYPSADGRLEAFVLEAGGRVLHKFQVARNGAWSEADEFFPGPALCAPSVMREADGRLTVFITALDGTLTVRSQLVPSGNWGAPQPFTGSVAPTVCGTPN